MSKTTQSQKAVTGYDFRQRIGEIEEYELKTNGLRVLYLNRPDTGVITTNITYFVGARDEARGETGIAHMLEHMLFKPTSYDNKHRISEGSAMNFERKTGSILNANTWKDRTTYYFSYPKEYLHETLRIEADRMENVILTDKVLKPEQGNVLSEFDMYNGDPHFALEVEMRSTAYFSHPYGHETLGYREDIEDFTAEKLAWFYSNYYRPDNAVMMIVGDIDRATALKAIKKHFGSIKRPVTPIPRQVVREPKQEGVRRVAVSRPSNMNIVSIGFKQPGFPTKDWFVGSVMLNVLAGGPESILEKMLVDTGKVASISSNLEPTSEDNLATLTFDLAPGQEHDTIEALVLKRIQSLKHKDIDSLVTKAKAGMITNELFDRTDSLHIVHELTEYASANDLKAYTKTANILTSIKTTDVLQSLKTSFADNNITIGHFIGK
jgi:zinc protease